MEGIDADGYIIVTIEFREQVILGLLTVEVEASCSAGRDIPIIAFCHGGE
jgi:hypothetical protein